MKKEIKIGVIGLGYVGLPVSVLFSTKYEVIGFDINSKRVESLNQYNDTTLEIPEQELKKAIDKNLKVTNQLNDLKDCNFYIITVPTPINNKNIPDLEPLKNATSSVSKILSKGDIVVYESTVYPGCTEEVCVPILEEKTGLKYNKDFFCGYSPERINPGDKEHTIDKIVKITSGSNEEVADIVDNIYKSVISVGTYRAESIRVAEAAKVIENAQRDINIAFVNELAMLFNILDIDTTSVLRAAATKWNFLNFKPGLVGGHCIGVDPYYLANKAIEAGFNPEIILAGRKVNDNIGNFIAKRITSKLKKNNKDLNVSSILILGVTFKENCPDYRNTKVVDVIMGLENESIQVDLYDPWVDAELFEKEYNLKVLSEKPIKKYDAIVLAVSHNVFKELDLKKFYKDENTIVYDVKSFYDKEKVTERL